MQYQGSLCRYAIVSLNSDDIDRRGVSVSRLRNEVDSRLSGEMKRLSYGVQTPGRLR
jgi:hypothetical protein